MSKKEPKPKTFKRLVGPGVLPHLTQFTKQHLRKGSIHQALVLRDWHLQGAYSLVELKDNFIGHLKCIIINHGEYCGRREQGIPKRVDCCWQEEIGEDLSQVEGWMKDRKACEQWTSGTMRWGWRDTWGFYHVWPCHVKEFGFYSKWNGNIFTGFKHGTDVIQRFTLGLG